MQRSNKLYMILDMSCILNCCTNKVPLTAMYVCLFLSLTLSVLSYAASVCIYIYIKHSKLHSLQGNWNGNCMSNTQNSVQSCTNPTKKIRSCVPYCCQRCSYQVFLPAISFRIAIVGHCKFSPSGFKHRLLETGPWTQFLLHVSYVIHWVNLWSLGDHNVISEMGAHSMWPSFRLSAVLPLEAWDAQKKAWRSPKLALVFSQMAVEECLPQNWAVRAKCVV